MALILKEAYTNHIQPCPNVWANTSCKNLATYCNKKRGIYFEDIWSMIMKDLGYKVINAETSNGPYDRIITGFKTWKCNIKVEIKGSLSGTDYKNECVDNYRCISNHIAIGKIYDIIMFMCIINKDGVAMYELRWCTREELNRHIKSEDSLFCKQQGGKKADNDDYMCSGKTKTKKLLANPLFKKIDLLELYIRDDKL